MGLGLGLGLGLEQPGAASAYTRRTVSNQVKDVTPRAAHLVRGRVRGRVRVRVRARASAKVRRRPPVGRIVTELVTNQPTPTP